MRVYRLIKEKYMRDLSGTGAKRAGAKWNIKGHEMLYTSESRSLSTAEIAVHTRLGNIPLDYFLITIEIPDSIHLFELKIADLPEDWKVIPHSNSTQLIGDKFLDEGKYLVMKVPSVVVPGDFNYLINPAHNFFTKIKIVDIVAFAFDKRLFKK
ncbi:MAG: RES family NAD+ phosphorylase [Ginsengibacter sp.]